MSTLTLHSYPSKIAAMTAAKKALGAKAKAAVDYVLDYRELDHTWSWRPADLELPKDDATGDKAAADAALAIAAETPASDVPTAKTKPSKAKVAKPAKPVDDRLNWGPEPVVRVKKEKTGPNPNRHANYPTTVAMASAEHGNLPPVPDFSAATHAGYRKKLAACVAMVEAGNIKGLEAVDIQPLSSSRTAIRRYVDIAIVALKAQAKSARAAKRAASKGRNTTAQAEVATA